MAFETETIVRFAHVDAAGIVFYPRYFEMLNAAVEDWFAAMGLDFATMHVARNMGVPTIKLDATFVAPSELGDRLTVSITPKEIGRSSCSLAAVFAGEGRERLRVDVVLVCMDLGARRSIAWPDELRVEMARYGDPAQIS
ncbi:MULTISPECIES: acyl-CoA thioesterase [unclassified Sphingomonas]|uniref:acyl-CoA thioesterase n=1 Tax=unclassified Sphingomonas TaxID=196159 RepID=UPI0006F7B835|nr:MULTISPECIES: thioesterase family protein [unclassified Sphingomonas]KQX22800.1 thioesterase [Sphingomonas sp. Root1294]KQY67720.1 thioesterase [Sphingomonas sp. Root50]KRB88662.1 thioesterase [Sphingomonas sp. Root720]